MISSGKYNLKEFTMDMKLSKFVPLACTLIVLWVIGATKHWSYLIQPFIVLVIAHIMFIN